MSTESLLGTLYQWNWIHLPCSSISCAIHLCIILTTELFQGKLDYSEFQFQLYRVTIWCQGAAFSISVSCKGMGLFISCGLAFNYSLEYKVLYNGKTVFCPIYTKHSITGFNGVVSEGLQIYNNTFEEGNGVELGFHILCDHVCATCTGMSTFIFTYLCHCPCNKYL